MHSYTYKHFILWVENNDNDYYDDNYNIIITIESARGHKLNYTLNGISLISSHINEGWQFNLLCNMISFLLEFTLYLMFGSQMGDKILELIFNISKPYYFCENV